MRRQTLIPASVRLFAPMLAATADQTNEHVVRCFGIARGTPPVHWGVPALLQAVDLSDAVLGLSRPPGEQAEALSPLSPLRRAGSFSTTPPKL